MKKKENKNPKQLSEQEYDIEKNLGDIIKSMKMYSLKCIH